MENDKVKNTLGKFIKLLGILSGIISVISALFYGGSIGNKFDVCDSLRGVDSAWLSCVNTADNTIFYAWLVVWLVAIGGVVSSIVIYGVGTIVCIVNENRMLLKKISPKTEGGKTQKVISIIAMFCVIFGFTFVALPAHASAFDENVCKKMGNSVAYFYQGFSGYRDAANKFIDARQVEKYIQKLKDSHKMLISELSPSLNAYNLVGCPMEKLQKTLSCIENNQAKDNVLELCQM